MATFKYIGNHPEIKQHDIVFRQNEPVDTTGKTVSFRKRVRLGYGKTEMRTVVLNVEDKLRGSPDFEECIMTNASIGDKPINAEVLYGNASGNQKQSVKKAKSVKKRANSQQS